MVDNTQEFDVVLTVKDDEGNTLENTDSIAFSADIVEGDSLAKLKGSQFVTPLIPSNGGTLPGKREYSINSYKICSVLAISDLGADHHF